MSMKPRVAVLVTGTYREIEFLLPLFPHMAGQVEHDIFLVLRHDRRRIVHVNVTEHPTAAWTAQQESGRCVPGERVADLLRDRDGIYGEAFRTCLETMEIDDVLAAPRSPCRTRTSNV